MLQQRAYRQDLLSVDGNEPTVPDAPLRRLVEMSTGNTAPHVPLVVVGCDFRTVSSALRELVSNTAEQRYALLEQLHHIDPDAGLLCLETCNRVEWIVSTEQPAWVAHLLSAQMLHRWKAATLQGTALPSPFVWKEEAAVEHLFRVVVGLESLAVGEAQIAGQFQDALQLARDEQTISPLLNRLGTAAGRLAQAAFQQGFRSDHGRGIHGLVVQTILAHRQSDADTCVAVAGMGVMGRKTAQILDGIPGIRVSRWNRSPRPLCRPLSKLSEETEQLDILVLATGASRALFLPEMLPLEKRRKPLLVLDIGHPRQATAALQEHPQVDYKGIDHFVQERLGGAPEWSMEMQSVMEEERQDFLRRCRERDWGHLLGRIHQQRHHFVHQRLNSFLDEHFNDLSPSRRRLLVEEIGGLLREYAHDIHGALHQPANNNLTPPPEIHETS